MTASNRLQLSGVIEVTAGTTPGSPRMCKERITGEALSLYVPEYVEPDELRDDRMDVDAVQVFKNSGGSYNFNISYPVDGGFRSNIYVSGYENSWVNSPKRDNDGTADSVITDVATTNTEVTHTTGPAFVANHLVQFSGFGVANNNGVFKCTTGGATTSRYVGSGITDEAAPPAAAKMEVVGFVGASGNITATATGLGSTTLDFTTLGLTVGMTVKIGGTAAGDKFATAALNNFATIAAIAADALTLANRPAGWTTDAGTGKTIKVWFGDVLKNGTTKASLTIEKGFLGQATPNYHVGRGMHVATLNHKAEHKKAIKGVVSFMGMGGSKSTAPQDASPDAAPTGRVFSANVNFARLMEGGASISAPNFCRSFEFEINNNPREVEDITADSPAGVNDGNCDVTIKASTYYGSGTLIDKFYSGEATSAFVVEGKDSQALGWLFPRFVWRGGGNPVAGGKNQDVMVELEGKASYDSTTGAHIVMSRLPYYES